MHLPLEPAELQAWLRLSMTSGIGNDAARRLLADFGSPEAIFAPGAAGRWPALVSSRQCAALAQPPDGLAALLQKTRDWLALGDVDNAADSAQRRCIAPLGHPAYPASLLEMADPPLMLYLLGSLAHTRWFELPLLAIVGSRNPTPQGEINAREFAKSLGASGWCVVSGLALGVDGAAHAGALASGGVTVAVVGTGLDRVYPKKHLDLARQIAAHGLLVSEFPLGTPPLTGNFPKRNRIIAGLSRGTLVVEAALKSGSLITARLASEQGKEVFAIPGSIHSPQSRGCHALIKQGAKLVETASDVLEELPLVPGFVATASVPVDNSLDTDTSDDKDEDTNSSANPLLAALGFDAVSFDELQARTGLATAQLQTQLLELELGGHVTRLPGGRFQRMALG